MASEHGAFLKKLKAYRRAVGLEPMPLRLRVVAPCHLGNATLVYKVGIYLYIVIVSI